MSKPMVKIHNIETDEVIVREMTDEEYNAHLADVAVEEARKAEVEAEAKAKAEAKTALLDKLGITEEEARLLLGGN